MANIAIGINSQAALEVQWKRWAPKRSRIAIPKNAETVFDSAMEDYLAPDYPYLRSRYADELALYAARCERDFQVRPDKFGWVYVGPWRYAHTETGGEVLANGDGGDDGSGGGGSAPPYPDGYGWIRELNMPPGDGFWRGNDNFTQEPLFQYFNDAARVKWYRGKAPARYWYRPDQPVVDQQPIAFDQQLTALQLPTLQGIKWDNRRIAEFLRNDQTGAPLVPLSVPLHLQGNLHGWLTRVLIFKSIATDQAFKSRTASLTITRDFDAGSEVLTPVQQDELARRSLQTMAVEAFTECELRMADAQWTVAATDPGCYASLHSYAPSYTPPSGGQRGNLRITAVATLREAAFARSEPIPVNIGDILDGVEVTALSAFRDLVIYLHAWTSGSSSGDPVDIAEEAMRTTLKPLAIKIVKSPEYDEGYNNQWEKKVYITEDFFSGANDGLNQAKRGVYEAFKDGTVNDASVLIRASTRVGIVCDCDFHLFMKGSHLPVWWGTLFDEDHDFRIVTEEWDGPGGGEGEEEEEPPGLTQ